jgi:uncharacterized membrane protein required for colicin V production
LIILAIAADILTAAVIFAGLVIGYKNGFLKMILSFVFLILAAVIASALANSLDDIICDRYVIPVVKSEITEYVDNVYDEYVTNVLPLDEFSENYHSGVLTANELNDIINTTVEKFTGGLKEYVGDLNLPFEIKLTNSELDETAIVFDGDDLDTRLSVLESPTVRVTDFLTEKIVRPTVIRILGNLIFTASFIILAIICSVVLGSLKLINKIPLLGPINRFAGAVLGLLISAMILYIMSLVFMIIINHNPEFQTVLDDTLFTKHVFLYLT